MNNQPNTLLSEENQRGCVVGGGIKVQVIRTHTWVTRVLDRYSKKFPTSESDSMRQLSELSSRESK